MWLKLCESQPEVQNPEENILIHAAADVKTTARPPAVCYRVHINLGITFKPLTTKRAHR